MKISRQDAKSAKDFFLFFLGGFAPLREAYLRSRLTVRATHAHHDENRTQMTQIHADLR